MLAGAIGAALWALVIAGLGAVFAPGGWMARAILISGASLIVACLLRASRRSLRLVAAAGGASTGLLCWLWWFVDTGRFAAWWSDPLRATAEARMQVIRGSTPFEPTGALEDLLLLAVVLGAALTCLVLVGLGRPFAAGAVTALLLLVPAGVNGVSVGWAFLLGAGVLLALLAWLGAPSPSLPGLLAAAVAAALAAAAVAVAPPTRDRVWNAAVVAGPVSGTVPDVTITLAEDLRRRSNAPAFSFTSDTPGAHRFALATLTDFADGRWLPQDEPDAAGLDVTAPRSSATLPPSPVPIGFSRVAPVTITITVEGLLSSWLPLPQSVMSVTAEESDFDPAQWSWTAESSTARADRTITRRGDRYTAVSRPLIAADGRLPVDPSSLPASATALFGDPAEAPESLAPYLELPPGMPDALRGAAREVAGGADNRLALGLSLQRWFRSGAFAYDESAPYKPDMDPEDPYAVMEGLLTERRGFCVHYASTFAVMARELGAPTRLAVGYAARSTEGGETIVRGRDLHAWPEIFVDGVGWVAFEPTPGGAGVRADTGEQSPPVEREPGAGEQPAATTEPPSTDPTDRRDRPQEAVEQPASPAAGAAPPGNGWPAGGAALILLLVLAGIPIVVRRLRAVRRMRSIARGRHPAQSVWAEFRDTAIDHGLLRRAAGEPEPRARTAEALVDHLVARGSLSGGPAEAARRLADAMAAERYGGIGGAGADPELAGLLRLAKVGIRDGAGRSARVRAVLLPRSVLRADPEGRRVSGPHAA